MMKHIFLILLVIHISCGLLSLLTALLAMLYKKGAKQHRFFGKLFFYGMTGVFITAIPMSVIHTNVFLFLIALFSYYSALTGWRLVKSKQANTIDFVISFAMLMIGFVMLVYGGYLYYRHDVYSTIILIFGAIGTFSAIGDLKFYRKSLLPNKYRIAKHLSAMLAATIAAVTAFTVTVINFSFIPTVLLWLTPTLLITPVIIWWNRKILAT